MAKGEYLIKVDNVEFTGKIGKDLSEVSIDGEHFQIEKLVTIAPGVYYLKVNGRVIPVEVKNKENGTTQLLVDGITFETEVLDETALLLRSFQKDEEDALKGNVKIKAPMPGLVVKILASEGSAVNKGDKVVIIEAMKMENSLGSPVSGTVSKIYVQEGQTVEKDAVLVEILA